MLPEVGPLRALVLAVVLVGACKSDADKAKAIVADTSRPPTAALTEAAENVWKDADGTRHSIGADCREEGCRLFVIINRKDQGSVAVQGSDVTITFDKVDSSDADRVSRMMSLGQPLKLFEVLVADRSKTSVLGKKVMIVRTRRTVATGSASESFTSWQIDDMARLEPYDLVIDDTNKLVLHDGVPVTRVAPAAP